MKIIEFFKTIGKLKNIKRTGWIRFKIPNPESVAEHSFRTAIMTMVLAPKVGADVSKSLKMALIHDIGEARIGDLVIMKGNKYLPNVLEKRQKETDAFKKIMGQINGDEYVKLFKEFEENKTREAKLVKEIDKLEMAMQALEYEEKHKINLDEFFESSRALISSEQLTEILKEIEKLRKK